MPPPSTNPVARRFDALLDRSVRPDFFRQIDFAGPQGDPGWFGPGSAVWHVHGTMPVMFLGLAAAGFLENLDPSISAMGMDHSRIVARVDGVPTGKADLEGLRIRFAHSLAFFLAVGYGSTESAERVTKIVSAMHHRIKGVRPDGLPYDADEPDWLRWNYATVVWGIASAHERYHPHPLPPERIEAYYRSFVRVGEALGGTDLPATKGEVAECLAARVPRLGVTAVTAGRMWPGIKADTQPRDRPLVWLLDWAYRDLLPDWGQHLIGYEPPPRPIVLARRFFIRSALRGLETATGPMREFTQAKARAGSPAEATHPLAGSVQTRL